MCKHSPEMCEPGTKPCGCVPSLQCLWMTAACGDNTCIMRIAWMEQRLKSAHSSLSVVMWQPREDCWMCGGAWGEEQWCEGDARWERRARAICKGGAVLPSSWQGPWNGIDGKGGKTHPPPLLCYLLGREKICILFIFSLYLKVTANWSCQNNICNVLIF